MGKLNRIDNNLFNVQLDKRFWFDFYSEYLLLLTENYFEWKGFTDDVDPFYLEKLLSRYGYCGFLNIRDDNDNIRQYVQNGALKGKPNIYGKQPIFFPTNFIRFNRETYGGRNYPILYNSYDRDTFGTDNTCVIIKNNSLSSSTTNAINIFASKLAEIENAIQMNRIANLTPYIGITSDENLLSMKTYYEKISQGEFIIYLKEQKSEGVLDATQLSDRLYVKNLDAPYLIDKYTEERNSLIYMYLTKIGINNVPIIKSERLITPEADANNGLINANAHVRLAPRKQACELINKFYDINVSCEPVHEVYRETINYDKEIEKIDRFTNNYMVGDF